MDEVIDVVNYEKCGAFGTENALIMQGRGQNFLMLSKLDFARPRMDGKKGTHAIEYRWLSAMCENPDDQAYVCVQGSDYILITDDEARDVLKAVQDGDSLFDLYTLF